LEKLLNAIKNKVEHYLPYLTPFLLTLTKPEVYSVEKIVSLNQEEFVSPGEDDIELTKMICESYSYMMETIETIEKTYRTGNFWNKVINEWKDGSNEAFIKGDVKASAFILVNFFKMPILRGLWEGGTWTGGGYPPLMKSYKRKLNFMYTTMQSYAYWKTLTNQPLEVVNLPDVGNPFGYEINGNIVSTAQFKLHYHSLQIFNLVNNIVEKPVVLEIGAGFGGIAYYLFKNGFNGTYLDFDIPDTLILAQFFLKKIFSDKKILIYSTQKIITEEDIEYYDIILMPNYMLKSLPNLCTDIVINTRSFSEMPMETIEEYMKQIDRICKKYLYHDNANFSSHDGEIPSYKFPIPSSFNLKIKAKNVMYGGINVKDRFVEHLYEKINQGQPVA